MTLFFGSANESFCSECEKLMTSEFDMSMMGELNFFLGLQIKQTEKGIFHSPREVCQETS